MPEIVRHRQERPQLVYSEVDGPIRRLSFLRRSLLFAELSKLSYDSERKVRAAAQAIGFPEVRFFEHTGTQAYQYANRFDCVIVPRGTEPDDWNDVQANANAATVLAETAGRVHRGFKKEVDDLWPMLEEALRSNTKPLWFCGHSLGGAMATICAGRCFLSYIACNPEELQTFGSPRVGDRRYVNYVKLTHYRWVNNNDIVPRVPPTWMGYRHRGTEMYLDYRGRIRKLDGWWRVKDRLHGLLRGLRKMKIDYFDDHGIVRYIDAILHAVAEEEQLPNSPADLLKLPVQASHCDAAEQRKAA